MILLNDDDLLRVGVRKKLWKDSIPSTADPFDKSNEGRFSLSKHFVDITTSKYNQDVMCNWNGKKGTGKSYSTLSVAYLDSLRKAEILGGHPTDYFDVERCVAVMDIDKLVDILSDHTMRDQDIIGDDNGVAHGARAWRGQANQLINNAMVVNRTLHNIYQVSTPELGMLDKQERSLPEHQIEMVKNLPGMAYGGFTTAKYFQRVTNPKTSDTYYVYSHWNAAKVVRIIIPRAPKKITDEYDKLREKAMKKQQDILITKHKEAKEGKTENKNSTSEGREAVREISEKMANRSKKAQEIMDQCRLAGMSDKEALLELKRVTGIARGSWYEWVKKGYVN